uniref:Reverse transcriptase domain-containing protein n=1 Tax=Kryptolebias marmoratus TaxID=37003 RepID=A0A3Q2ZWL1_KRYMA
MVRTNFQTSKPFKLQRGTRQGCPLSPLLFDLAIEPVAIALKTSKEISGIWRNDMEHKVSHYADDLLLFISKPSISLPFALDIFSQFGQISGYKLNLTKSELFPIGNKANLSDFANLPLRIERQKFTYLGITVTKTHKNLFKCSGIFTITWVAVLSGCLWSYAVVTIYPSRPCSVPHFHSFHLTLFLTL